MTVAEFRSSIDHSVNYSIDTEDGGKLEARFVTRGPENSAIIYVSSATGCARACRMCWLTQTGQTMQRPATVAEITGQVLRVLDHEWFEKHKNQGKTVSVSFMARGEPLDNPHILSGAALGEVQSIVAGHGFVPKIKISTIMPAGLPDHAPVFDRDEVRIYYSLYGFDPNFRKRWLPKAMSPEGALDRLSRHRGEVVIHGCFIDGENDNIGDVVYLIERCRREMRDKPWRFNLVRFNPYDGSPYQESQRLDAIESQFASAGIPFKRVSRVGIDVAASCGVFLA